MEKTEQVNRITSREEDFSQWYQDVVSAADLAEHSGVRGAMIIKPYGYALWENIQRILDQKIKETGHKNAYFPLFIPESYLKREAEHVEGFSPELAVVTHAGGEKLDEPLVVRPTSETIIYATFSKWIQSWRDLPLLINQWANVVRWEMRPRLFLRTTEFLWQEGHTAHATEEEAEQETRKMLGVYQSLAEEYLAMPVIPGQKTEAEKFAGALRTYSIEAMMQDGKALQAGTSHNLGQNFAKVFDVKYADRNGVMQYVWQTSWGVSTRLIGGIVLTHSDNAGLVLPPNIAPIKVIIIPIWRDESSREIVLREATALQESLRDIGIVDLDDRDNVSAGVKFNEWEKKGVPIRIEIGPRDIEQGQVVLVRRDTGEKQTVVRDNVHRVIAELLNQIQRDLYECAKQRLVERSFITDDYVEFKKYIDQGGFVYSHWCGSESCEKAINAETKATIRCIPFDRSVPDGKCLKCGTSASQQVVFAKSY